MSGYGVIVLRGWRNLKGFCGDPADAAEYLPCGPVAFGVGKEDFAGAADFRAVIPAFEESQMALALS